MKKFTIVGAALCAACARGGTGADSAAVGTRDSAVVAGPAVVPTTQTPAPATSPVQAPTTSSSATKRPPTVAPAPPTEPESLRAAPTVTTRVDSTRGIISVVGTSFEKRVMVAERGTQRRFEVTGRLASLVGHVAGADVSVVGTRSGTQIDAKSFMVRAVDGQPAIDGTLRTENGILYIVTAAGTRTRIVAPPPPLVGQDGARVWITGDPAKGVSSFGFIDPPR